jgi:thiamine biosynthesis lipoprotein
MPSKLKLQNHRYSFEAIGTQWSIDLLATKNKASLAINAIRKSIEQFDKNYSRFRSDSLITQISRAAGDYIMPADFSDLYYFYQKMYEVSDGLVTPLIGDALSAAGYDATYSFKPSPMTKAPAWKDVLSYDPPLLSVKTAVLLDFGAAGKGYLVDIVVSVCIEKGIESFVIDAGGDIYCHGVTEQIGLENPDNLSEVVGIVDVHNQAICASAGNKRKWANFNHILNPKTLSSPSDIKAVWAIADSAMLADGMSTCLFFIKPETLSEAFKFDYMLIKADNTTRQSKRFKGGIFYQKA